MDERISRWQTRGAVVGSIAWFVMFEGIASFREWGWEKLSNFSMGYVLSCLVGFSYFIIVQAIKGNTRKICDYDDFMTVVYVLCSVVILSLGAAGLYLQNFGNMGQEFGVGFVLGSAVFGKCIAPTINRLEDARGRRQA